MEAWWLALDPEYADYRQLRIRRVVAQGWPLLGDVAHLCALAGQGSRQAEFEREIDAAFRRPGAAAWREVSRRTSDRERDLEDGIARAQKAMWSYLQIQPGDLVVAVEGTLAKGVCRVNGGYWYDRRYHFAQCFGHDVAWHDWQAVSPVQPPHVPRRLLSAKKVGEDREVVLAAWANAPKA